MVKGCWMAHDPIEVGNALPLTANGNADEGSQPRWRMNIAPSSPFPLWIGPNK